MQQLILFCTLGAIACTGGKEPSEPATEPAMPSESGNPIDTGDTEPPAPAEYMMMDPVNSLTRISLALRGIRPSKDEILAVRDDPSLVESYALEYTNSPEFGLTIRDMYAEQLRMRALDLILPNLGVLEDISNIDLQHALAEEPLALIEQVVLSEQPFTTIVTADWSVLNETSSLIWGSHTYDFSQGGEQTVNWTDGRPAAGILSTSSMLLKHDSTGANYHRGRTNTLTDVLLCAPFAGRDIPLTGDIDLSDDEAVATAVNTQTECIGCHQALDPLAAHYWVFRARLSPFQVNTAYGSDFNCANLPPQFSCYPVEMYAPSYADRWMSLGLRPPNYWGASTTDMGDVGQLIAEDPRFSLCAAERFSSYLTQKDADQISFERIAELQQLFIDGNFNAKQLAYEIVTDPAFLALDATPEAVADDLPGIQIIRPEQLDRMFSDLTGLEWTYFINRNNIGDIKVLLNDSIGFRAMAGGVDGVNVTYPTHTPTPIKLLVLAAYAEEAAGYVVEEDFALPANERTLLTLVEPSLTSEAPIRQQISILYAKILGVQTATDSEDVDAAWDLFSQFSQEDPELAWKTLIAAMLQSPEILFY